MLPLALLRDGAAHHEWLQLQARTLGLWLGLGLGTGLGLELAPVPRYPPPLPSPRQAPPGHEAPLTGLVLLEMQLLDVS